MGLLGVVQLYLTIGFQLRALPDLLEHGDYDASLLDEYGYEQPFTATHFFRRAELVDCLSDADLTVDRVVGLEGLGSPFHDDGIRDNVSDLSEVEREALKRTIGATNADPVVADPSVLMLAIARGPGRE